MEISIPNKDGKFMQTNDGELSGNIFASWNLDLDSNPGVVRVSPQTQMLLSNANDSALVYPIKFLEFNDSTATSIWALCDGVLLRTESSDPNTSLPVITSWTQDMTTGTPTDLDYLNSDMVAMDGSMIVSAGSNLHVLHGDGTWIKNWKTFANNGGNNPTVLERAFNNLLVLPVGQQSTNAQGIATIDTTGTTNNPAFNLQKQYRVIWIKTASNLIWIGTRNIYWGKAKIFAWDGYSESWNYDYEINSSYSLAGIIKNDIPYTINERGELLAFNGSGFQQIAKFPSFNSSYNFSDDNVYLASIGRNCMTVVDNQIHILVNTSVNDAILENQLSGVWVYDEAKGLRHKYSITKSASGITDYGSPLFIRPGALYPLPKNSGSLLIGCSSYLQDMSSTISTSPSDLRHSILNVKNAETDETDKIGYFITPKIQTQNIEENWQKVYVLIKKLLNSTDKVYVKYRTDYQDFGALGVGENPYFQKATWVDTNMMYFNSTDDTSYISVGDEVEILAGEGSGLSANISSISGSFFVIDETVASASGSINARVSNWKKTGTEIATQGLRNFQLPLDVRSSWIQFKIVAMWKGKNEIEKLFVVSKEQLKPV